MINIDFPADPSGLQFIIDRDFGSTYLIARAARLYGAKNIDVVCVISGAVDFDYLRIKNAHAVADAVGITLRLIGGDTNPQQTIAGVHAMAEQLKVQLGTFIDYSKVAFEFNTALTAANALKVAGWLDNDFNRIEGATGRTLVTGTTTDTLPLIKAKFGDIYSDTYSHEHMWGPLINNTDSEVLASAAEEGLIDIVLKTQSCSYERPYHCGACMTCMRRKHDVVQAGVTDNTLYEY